MNIAIIVFYVVIIGAMMYFMAIKPQKKEQKRQQELMASQPEQLPSSALRYGNSCCYRILRLHHLLIYR